MDGVQCGYFRAGRFQFSAFSKGCRTDGFFPDRVSMAKSLGAVSRSARSGCARHTDLLSPGLHATTFGGTPLACAVAMKVLEIVARDRLADNARTVGAHLKSGLENLARQFPRVLTSVRGLGLMIGFELADKEAIPAFASGPKTAAAQFVLACTRLACSPCPPGRGLCGCSPLNLSRAEADEGLAIIEQVVRGLA